MLAVCVFLAKARWRPSTTRAKQWPGKAEDERTRNQDGMEKTRRKRCSGREAVAMICISSKYDGAEDSGAEDLGVDGSHVN